MKETDKKNVSSSELAKFLLAVIGILVALVLMYTLGTYVAHRYKSSREMEILEEYGYVNPVSVGDHCLNVAVFGNPDGKHTIVALSGLWMGDFSVTEREMTAYVEDDCKVVFIDRAGYGLSDDTDEDMTLSFIVEDYRKALQNAGIEGPYVLLPHSIGGAYATYWCSLYPEEIEGIVFLDGTQLSEHVFEGDSEEKPGFSDKVASLKARLGFRRDEEQFDYRNYGGNYTEDEQKMRAAMFYRTYDSIASYMEYGYHVQNCQEAFRLMVTTEDIPKIYISSSWGFDDEAYEQVRQALLVPYLEKLGNCELVLMPGDHLIYMDRPDDCGMLLRAFIDGLDGE